MKKITIIGTGYVGLVTGAGISEFGHDVTCVDIDKNKIQKLNLGEIPIYEPELETIIKNNKSKGSLNFGTDINKAIKNSQIIFIAVGTPMSKNGDSDLSAIEEVAKIIGANLNSYKVICTKSTVPVGTGKKIEEIIKSINKSIEFDYVSNPEFLREGAAVKDFLIPDRVVIGSSSQKAFEIMQDVYRPLYLNETPIVNTNVETAEMVKYASNAFLALKISYINEIANLCELVGVDVHVVSKTMGQDGRISSKFLHPGPGFGGSCLPKDTMALANTGKKNKIKMNTVEAAIKTNNEQKLRMVDKLKSLLDNKIKDKTITVLGLAFKPKTDDIRDAASTIIIPKLINEGAIINTYDPVAMDNFKSLKYKINYFDNWQDAVRGADALILLTEWNEFRGMDLLELKSLLKEPRVLDTKNILSIKKLNSIGFSYDNVGRKGIS
ncbi:MAG: UDP-glucose/GDP-mannose dehydrogenase family protein [Candidatus Marinimicrobia bacterium]|nr:UDP-glucose/GDP-mannose dehydrogenase family protein [Candidatus Neomarinimicrobiota bacterium]